MIPIQAAWRPDIGEGGAFVPLPRFHNAICAEVGAGEIVTLERQEERSEISHRHEFAWLREAYSNLPETIAADYPTVEHLRKRALINTGWCTVKDHVCASRAEALRFAAALRRELDEYAVVVVQDAVVRSLRPKSQAHGKMKAADFQTSKQAILDWVAELIGVDPATLSSTTERAPATAASGG